MRTRSLPLFARCSPFGRTWRADGLERHFEAGPWAIERFVAEPRDTRFLQSFKTFAASAAFVNTWIGGASYTFEDLLAGFLVRFRQHAGERLAELPATLVIGRPVTFAGPNPDAGWRDSGMKPLFTG